MRSRLGLLARTTVVLAVSGTFLALTGCSSSQASGVSATAEQFYAALGESDGTEACALLSATTRTELEQSAGKVCSEAILGEDLPEPGDRGTTRVYGTMAIVTAAGDTMFLSRFPQGWLVTGVGCEPTGEAERYDCTVAAS